MSKSTAADWTARAAFIAKASLIHRPDMARACTAINVQRKVVWRDIRAPFC
jgi:hypothetical protein